jgi:hypothetical protein
MFVRFNFFCEPLFAAQTVDDLVSRRLNNPCRRRIRDSSLRPLIDRGGKCLLRAVFCQIEITVISN